MVMNKTLQLSKQTQNTLCVGELLCVGRKREMKMINVDHDKVWKVLGKLVVLEVILASVVISIAGIQAILIIIKEVI